MRRNTTLVGSLVLILSACSGDAAEPLFESSTTTSPSTTVAAVDALTVGAGGGVVSGEGVELDVLPGTFPADTAITITEADQPPLPEGATGVGSVYSITAASAPALPVVVSLPLPAATPTDGLLLLRTADDGTQQLIGGAVEGDRYVAAVPGFSRLWIVAGYDALALIGAPVVTPAIVRGVEVSADLREAVVDDELDDLANGFVEAPAARSVRLVGPGELVAGAIGTFSAIDFLSATPHLLRYQWNAYGPVRVLDGQGAQVATFEAAGEGRAVITVEVTDPRVGASAFASLRVFVGEAGSPSLTLIPDRDAYPRGTTPSVTALTTGLVAPVTFHWSTGVAGGDSVVEEGGATELVLPPVGILDAILTVTATDAGGTALTARVGIPRSYESCVLVGLHGPARVDWGQPVHYEILAAPGVDTDAIFVQAYPPAEIEQSGLDLQLTFNEPGVQVVQLDAPVPNQYAGCKMPNWHLVAVTGPALPISATLVEPPTLGVVGERVQFTVEIQGGILIDEDFDDSDFDPQPSYRLTATWGDGKTRSDQVKHHFASVPRIDRIGHVYDEPGDYTVEFVVESAGDLEFAFTHTITITPAGDATWHAAESCAAEGEGYLFRWTVVVSPPEEGATAWQATVYFHDCPGGGRVRYQGEAALTAPGQWLVDAARTDAAGALGAGSPASAEITLVQGEAPVPNFAG